MSEYVTLKCSLCSTETASLECLEGHIWNTHLRTFQYNCGECGYPALNYQALASHFQSVHQSCQEISFKRKISDEIKLREIVEASIVVVPIYDDSEEQIYDDHGQVPQVVDAVENGNTLTDQIPIEDLHLRGQMIENVNPNNQQLIYVTNNQQEYSDNLKIYGSTAGTSMVRGQDEEIVDDSELVDCEDDNAYAIYSGHELLDDGFQYVDEEGNTVYVTEEYSHADKSHNRMDVRTMKQRRIGSVVDEVANNRPKKRKTTIWTCPDCGKTIRYPSRIEEHRRMHAGVRIPCPECGQKFTKKGAMTCHLRTHSGEKPYACTWDCGRTFVSSSAQRMHEKHHSGEKSFACSICSKLFGKRSHLLRHEQTVHHINDSDLALQPKGLEAAGNSIDILKDIVEGIVEDVQTGRVAKKEEMSLRSR